MAARNPAVKGSNTKAVLGARAIAAAPRDESLQVTVRLRGRQLLPDPKEMLRASSVPFPILTHQEFERRYGTTKQDFAAIRRFAQANNLAVVRESPARRTAILAGTVEHFDKAFQVSLKIYEYPDGTYRGRTGPIRIPKRLQTIVKGVFGLDNRPVAHRAPSQAADLRGKAKAFEPNRIAALYNFPDKTDGSGQTIGVIELGGGYRPAELKAYFRSLGLKPAPIVIPVAVDGGANAPGGEDDSEVALDIEVIGACAPRARIVVYFSTNDRTSDGFLDALTKAVHDDQYSPSVISVSWGASEDQRTRGFRKEFDRVLQEAAMLGVTVCVASGDNGAANEPPVPQWDGLARVIFPASSPFALACGGTRLIADHGKIKRETVWKRRKPDLKSGSFSAGGGGVSQAFRIPGYQLKAGVPRSVNRGGTKGRGIPDVTGNGDPSTGYRIYNGGQTMVVGGTSAVAPLWAALIARINQKLGARVGFINPQLYALPQNSGAFNDIITGDNKCTNKRGTSIGYQAGPGWDACSGLGSPNGEALASLLNPAPRVDMQSGVGRKRQQSRPKSSNRATGKAKRI
jgi:kumamolisin